MRNPIYSDYAYSNSPTYPAARRGVGIGGQDSLDMFKNEYDTGKSYTNQIQQQNVLKIIYCYRVLIVC